VLATFDRHVDTDAPQDPGHSVRVGTDKGKLLQAASGRRIRARVGCGRVPLNEERKQALTRVCEIQGPPIQDAAIGAGTRAGSRPVERDSRLAKNLGKPIEVVTAEDDVIQHGDAFVAARDRTGQKSRPDVLEGS